MKLFIFILLSFCFLNSGLVYASNCFKPNPVKKDLEKADKEVSVASNKQIQKPIPKHVLKKAQKSVWQIGDSLGSGTGFFISPNEFVTNFHIVDNVLGQDSYEFTLSQKDNSKNLKVKKVKHLSPRSDLAVLEIEGEVSDYLNLAQKNPHPQENLFLVGYSRGKFRVVNKAYDISYENELEYMFFADSSFNRGGSGAPVINQKGEVAGVLRGGSLKGNSLVIVKTTHLQNLLEQEPLSFKNPKDYLKHSIKELRQMANGGDAIAQFRLGILHENGWGVEKNLKEAARWIQKSAEQEFAPAQFKLGIFRLDGLGIKKDPKEAARLFEKAAKQGDAMAQFSLGVLYEYGKSVKQDYKEATRWYRLAAKQGHARAQFKLGVFYALGKGMKKDPEEAARWTQKAAEQGHVEAQFNLGFAYEHGEGVRQDYKEAARWFGEAAEQGLARAQFKLDLLHTLGKDMKKDPEEAVRWTQKTVEQEHAEAQKEL